MGNARYHRGPASREPSQRHVVDSSIALLVAELCDEIVRHCQANGFTSIVDCPQYGFFERLCYAVGFVAPDMRHLDGVVFQSLLSNQAKIELLDFPDLRRFIHTLWRGERHSHFGAETGGGHIIGAVRSGSLSAVAERLRELMTQASAKAALPDRSVI